ncbi:MAG: polysaccharide export protein [Alphaproteobacteria bacterium]|nr:polysaccharide export protein [Alphaproteobacteria bacterium]
MTLKNTSSLFICLMATAIGVSACGGTPAQDSPSMMESRHTSWNKTSHNAALAPAQKVAPSKIPAQKLAALANDNPTLNVGDAVKVTTFGHEDLSGEFKVESNGTINLPLVGNIKATGRTKEQLEYAIRKKLSNGYLVDPKVSVEVANFRQFYIVGEVQEPGAYDYVPSLNVLKAVAIAGGFNRRAVTDDFKIMRRENGAEKQLVANEESLVLPGDTVRVEERFF